MAQRELLLQQLTQKEEEIKEIDFYSMHLALFGSAKWAELAHIDNVHELRLTWLFTLLWHTSTQSQTKFIARYDWHSF